MCHYSKDLLRLRFDSLYLCRSRKILYIYLYFSYIYIVFAATMFMLNKDYHISRTENQFAGLSSASFNIRRAPDRSALMRGEATHTSE